MEAHLTSFASQGPLPSCAIAAYGSLSPDSFGTRRMQLTAAPGHVWTAPGWQELSSRVQQWSGQPCVRPVSAVHVTAGHNALRGSDPGQKHAFDNALARAGCPDRRVDRLGITCCSLLPTIPITPRARQVPCCAHPASSSPTSAVASAGSFLCRLT